MLPLTKNDGANLTDNGVGVYRQPAKTREVYSHSKMRRLPLLAKEGAAGAHCWGEYKIGSSRNAALAVHIGEHADNVAFFNQWKLLLLKSNY